MLFHPRSSLYLHQKAHAAIAYLWSIHREDPNPESSLVWHPTCQNVEKQKLDDYLHHAFQGRCGPGPENSQFVSDFFPTVRERLACRQWLVDLMLSMNLDIAVLDSALPHEDTYKAPDNTVNVKAKTPDIPWEEYYLRDKAQAALTYLWALETRQPHPETLRPEREQFAHAPEVQKISISLFWSFPTMSDSEYRPKELVYDYFPTARDRLGAREWLEKICMLKSINLDLLDRAFSKPHITSGVPPTQA